MDREEWCVLIVDSSPAHRAEIGQHLVQGSTRRYHFVEAGTGAAGLRALLDAAHGPTDCVVLDDGLPDMDATDLLLALAGPNGGPICPVVVLTGRRAHAGALLRAGAQDCLGREWMSPESLTWAVESAVDRWAMARELRERERGLRANEHLLRLAMEASSAGAWEWYIHTGEVAWSEELRRLFGVGPEHQASPESFLALVHPDDREEAQARIRELYQGLEPTTEDFRFVRPDGAERWMTVRAEVIDRDEQGRPSRLVGAMLDITERKTRERQLAEQARLLDLSNDAIVVRDLQDRILYWNKGAVETYGYSVEEARGQVMYELLRAEFPAPLDAILARLHRDDRWSGELIHVRRDGARLIVSSRWALDRDPYRRPVAILETNTDITAHKMVEETLREADRRKDEFLATLAHELRNPLAPIRTGLQVLNRTRDPESARRTQEIMERQIDHMVRLIDDLLDVSRITSGKVTLQRERVSLQDVVEAGVDAARPLIESARHELTLDLPEQPVWLDADPARLAQVVSNLLTNSAKYTPTGGQITLSARRDGEEAVLAVSDTGLGIPPDMLGRIFEMFTQVNRTLDRAQGGLGIGLALARQLVQMHGGTIAVESPGPGQGSTFTVRLPAAVQAPPPPPEPVHPAGTTPLRVLVVDDNMDAAESLAMLLELEGHETRTAFSGLDALSAAASFAPHLVFLDIGMPRMSGYEVATRFRADPALAPAVLVALTGWGSQDDKHRAKEAGFDFHLTKPVDAAAVDEILEAARGRQARA